MNRCAWVVAVVSFATATLVNAQPDDQASLTARAKQPVEWLTLGTMGGPRADPQRSQPANALKIGNQLYLVDTGDGAVQRLGQAGNQLAQVQGVFLSHLHFDHTGGLWAVLGLRLQGNPKHRLTVYGPPGTKALVDGMMAAMQPAVEVGYGFANSRFQPPAQTISVVEMRDGDTVALPDMKVSVVSNTHYDFPPGSKEAKKYQSLSLRFDTPSRSIVYTGDTGPSEKVVKLAHKADLLVSEMIDLPAVTQFMRASAGPAAADPTKNQTFKNHLGPHHLSPEQVADLAKRAGVGGVVVTHIVAGKVTTERAHVYEQQISREFGGPVTVASDLNIF